MVATDDRRTIVAVYTLEVWEQAKVTIFVNHSFAGANVEVTSQGFLKVDVVHFAMDAYGELFEVCP